MNFNEVKLKLSDRVMTLENVNITAIRIKDDVIPIDILLLFQRVMLKIKTDKELKKCFKYEWSPIQETSQDMLGK